MKNIDNIEFALQQLKLAYKNLKAQEEIVKEHEKAFEQSVLGVQRFSLYQCPVCNHKERVATNNELEGMTCPKCDVSMVDVFQLKTTEFKK